MEGHIEMFEFFGGVSRRLIYDNMRTAVQDGWGKYVRKLNEHFRQLMVHYAAQAEFCNPGKSNLLPEQREDESDKKAETNEFYDDYKLLTENWDSPIILTTMVQFLETLYGAGTNKCRRMHQLVNSVIIFDEIQTLKAWVALCATWLLLARFIYSKRTRKILPNIAPCFSILQKTHESR